MNQQDLYTSFGFPDSRPVLIGLILFLQLIFLPYNEVCMLHVMYWWYSHEFLLKLPSTPYLTLITYILTGLGCTVAAVWVGDLVVTLTLVKALLIENVKHTKSGYQRADSYTKLFQDFERAYIALALSRGRFFINRTDGKNRSGLDCNSLDFYRFRSDWARRYNYGIVFVNINSDFNPRLTMSTCSFWESYWSVEHKTDKLIKLL